MNGRESGHYTSSVEQGPTALARLEARRLELIKTGELIEPDIAGPEAFELVMQLFNSGHSITREDLQGRALRVSWSEMAEIAGQDGWIDCFIPNWQDSFLKRGEISTDTTNLEVEEVIIFPQDLLPFEEYERALEVEAAWLERDERPEIHALFDESNDEMEMRRRILLFYSQ